MAATMPAHATTLPSEANLFMRWTPYLEWEERPLRVRRTRRARTPVPPRERAWRLEASDEMRAEL
ncbi:hypothetical protein GCM10009552_14250 [Rothia nasimurium]